jgi:hypothetical protein
VERAEGLLKRLREQFGGRFEDAAKTLEGNLKGMKATCEATYG